MPKARCAHCGAAFTSSANRTRYCGWNCYRAALQQKSADTLVARFWAKVQKTQGCWLWTGGTIRGYGQFNVGRVADKQHTVYAHRHAWAITNGPIGRDVNVCHSCDVPLCVNPNHLFLGSQAENLNDARRKGRLVPGRHLIKVSDDGMRDIMRRYRPGRNGLELASEYGVCLNTILRLAAGSRKQQRQPLGLSGQGNQTVEA